MQKKLRLLHFTKAYCNPPDIEGRMNFTEQAAAFPPKGVLETEEVITADDMDSQEVIITPDPDHTNSGLMSTTFASDIKCMICDFDLDVLRYDVNFCVMPKSGVNLLLSVNKVLNESNVTLSKGRSSFLCDNCFNLFDNLEIMEEQVKLIRNTLHTNFTKTCELYNQLITSESLSVECQTDLLYSDIPIEKVKEEEPVVKRSRGRPRKKKPTRSRITRSKTKRKTKYCETSEDEDNTSMEDDLFAPDNDEDFEVPIDNISDVPAIDNTVIVKPDPDAEDSVPLPVKSIRSQDTRKRNRRIHPCEHCLRMFRSATEVKNHILVKHLDKNPNHCVFCEKKFTSRHGLTMHLKHIHNIGFNENKELVTNVVHREDPVEPVDESLLFEQQNILDDMVATSDIEASDHEDAHSETKDSDCRTKMSRSLSRQKENRGALSRSRSRSKITKVTVPYLSEEGIGVEQFVLKQENEEEEGDVKHIDLQAETEIGGKKKRKRNRAPRTGERACMPLIHECPTCGKKWRTVSELNAHIQTHSDLRPWVCEICGQGYKMRKALLVHVGMHNGVHPFTCNYCNKSFTQKVGLEKHMFIHTGTKRYQCDLCGKGFIHLKSYQIHKMIHSGERSIRCDICNLALLSKSHLKQHLRVHTGERPHECEVCGKKFAKKSNLNAHKKKVHQLLLPPGRVPQLPDGELIPPPVHHRPPVPAAPGLLMIPTPQELPLVIQPITEMTLLKTQPRPSLKCELCEYTSSRKQALDEHWEREHGRFINNYTTPYESYTM